MTEKSGPAETRGVATRLNRPLSGDEQRVIRRHLLLIPVYAWIIVAWTAYAIDLSPRGHLDRSGHVKGHDFLHFYVQGEMARDRAATELYSFEAHAARADALVPEYPDRFLPVHPPQVALFFSPLAALPYGPALTVWLVVSAAVYLICCRALYRALPALHSYRGTITLLAVGFPAFYSLIAFGQTSAFALAWFTLTYFALRHHRPWLAGLALGALAYKPSLLVVIPFAWLAAGEYRMVAAAIGAAVVEFAAAYVYFGASAISGYVANFRSLAEHGSLLEARPELMHSLRSFFALLVPWPALAWIAYGLASGAVVWLAVRVWKSRAPLDLRYGVLVLATIIVDPHVYTYELVVLAIAFALLASAAIELGRSNTPFWVLMYLSYYLPALDELTSVTRVQWSVPALVGLLLISARSARSVT
jgi:hypothetical protein